MKEPAMRLFVLGMVVAVVMCVSNTSSADDFDQTSGWVHDPDQGWVKQTNPLWPAVGGPRTPLVLAAHQLFDNIARIRGQNQQPAYNPGYQSGVQLAPQPVYQWFWNGYQWALYR